MQANGKEGAGYFVLSSLPFFLFVQIFAKIFAQIITRAEDAADGHFRKTGAEDAADGYIRKSAKPKRR